MIHSVYVIHQVTGICVIYRKYGTIEFNEDLIAGFLTALGDFSKEVTRGKGNLKILDMVVYNIHLVFKNRILVAAASDKKDSKEIAQNKLEIILNQFIDRYLHIFEDWKGDVRIFEEFDEYIDYTLRNGKAAEIPRTLPLLRIFDKDYKKAQKALKKGATLGEDILEESVSVEWKNKRLPEQVIKQGMLTENEYKIAHLCDGSKDINEIAEEIGITFESAQLVIDKLDRLDMIKLVRL
ncbi:MAG: hypothetical protein JW776_03540 [Candidatus Lokiarchaeota archaeon]|nr:hypothetical protein [Candidatus Lokiarchaeota archaeon]